VEPIVTLDAAGVSLGGQPILRGVELSLTRCETVGVFGPNGSGKTTLLRLLATLLRPDTGVGTVLGAGLGSREVFGVRPAIGLISHRPAVIDELTIGENLEHAARLRGVDPIKIENALRVVGLDQASHRRAGASSFGMLRRVEVARLLMTRPRLLLLDEAFSALDSEAASLIDALVARTLHDDGAVVMVSHDQTHLEERSGRLLSLASGRLEPVS
jgi:heme exporter protein A